MSGPALININELQQIIKPHIMKAFQTKCAVLVTLENAKC